MRWTATDGCEITPETICPHGREPEGLAAFTCIRCKGVRRTGDVGGDVFCEGTRQHRHARTRMTCVEMTSIAGVFDTADLVVIL